jgi:hypothetical protein
MYKACTSDIRVSLCKLLLLLLLAAESSAAAMPA